MLTLEYYEKNHKLISGKLYLQYILVFKEENKRCGKYNEKHRENT